MIQSTLENGLRLGREAFQNIEGELGRVREGVEAEIQRVREEADRRRQELTETAQAELRRLTETAVALRQDVGEKLTDSIAALLGNLDIATASDLAKIDRKLTRLSRRIRELETAVR